jgi:hypothetical protein
MTSHNMPFSIFSEGTEGHYERLLVSNWHFTNNKTSVLTITPLFHDIKLWSHGLETV